MSRRTPPGSRATRSQAALLKALIANDDLSDSAPAALAHAAFPGTAEKIDIMIVRRKAHECLYHPDDITTLEAIAMGRVCTTDANGAVQWQRPVDERSRRSLILSAQAALRARRAAGEKAG